MIFNIIIYFIWYININLWIRHYFYNKLNKKYKDYSIICSENNFYKWGFFGIFYLISYKKTMDKKKYEYLKLKIKFLEKINIIEPYKSQYVKLNNELKNLDRILKIKKLR